MKKSVISTAVALVMGTAGAMNVSTSQAALQTGSVLGFAPGAVFCQYGGTPPNNCQFNASDVQGSFFTMDGNGDGIVQVGEKTPISANDGIILGLLQGASGNHPGLPGTGTTTENPGIDNPWEFFKNTGMHQTVGTPITVANNLGGGVFEMDFSGWSVIWADKPSLNMGGGIQDCGTTSDGICALSGIDYEGTYDNGTGLATLTCSTVSCSTSSTFTLTYAAIVPIAAPSGFGGVPFTLNLAGGHVGAPAAVPIPPAAWLFGSGLLGLLGVARAKKQRTGI